MVWLTDDPDSLRYLLFQAFAAAAEYADEGEPYVSYAALKQRFKIKVGKRTVKAEPRRSTPLEALRVQIQQKVVVKEIYETADIIATLAKHNATEIIFEGAHIEDLNLRGLYEIATRRGYYMIPATTHLTFSKNREDEEIAWSPEEA